jgi:hypothetical protein
MILVGQIVVFVERCPGIVHTFSDPGISLWYSPLKLFKMPEEMLCSRECFPNGSVMPTSRVTFKLLSSTLKRFQVLLEAPQDVLVLGG